MDSAAGDPIGPGFPIRTSADQSSLAAPHGFSQRVTSFIASVRQGIHQMLFKRLIQQNPSHADPKRKKTPSPSAGRQTLHKAYANPPSQKLKRTGDRLYLFKRPWTMPLKRQAVGSLHNAYAKKHNAHAKKARRPAPKDLVQFFIRSTMSNNRVKQQAVLKTAKRPCPKAIARKKADPKA